MTSRHGELLVTDAMQRCLNALNVPGAYAPCDMTGYQNGVFLVGADTIHVDTHWRRATGANAELIRRRIVVDVRCEEEILDGPVLIG